MTQFLLHKYSEKNFSNKEAGNILIYILGAIFLLGILVVMVRGSSTPGSNIDRETLLLRVAEVQEYGQELERAVRYILQDGFSEEDIRFAHPTADVAYGDITDNPARQVFSPQGGGALYRVPPDGVQTTTTPWVFTSANTVGTSGSGDCLADSCTDLIALLSNVTQNFCIEINYKSNMENPAGNPPIDESAFDSTTLFDGTYTRLLRIRDATPSLFIAANTEGCFESESSAGTYHYYRVLLAR